MVRLNFSLRGVPILLDPREVRFIGSGTGSTRLGITYQNRYGD